MANPSHWNLLLDLIKLFFGHELIHWSAYVSGTDTVNANTKRPKLFSHYLHHANNTGLSSHINTQSFNSSIGGE